MARDTILAMRILLVRHGESEGNASGIVQGHMDFGLTALGRLQAARLAEHLANEGAVRIVSSPLRRAWETADILSQRLALPIEPDARLQEHDVGAISGLNAAQIRERFPEIIAAWQKGIRPTFPGAEEREAFHRRVRAALDHLATFDETVIAVAHGGVIASICYAIVGADTSRRGLFETANCAVTEVTKDRAGRLVLARMNDTCHLDDLVTTVDRG
jgi:broad specificity phosphatase PhoE